MSDIKTISWIHETSARAMIVLYENGIQSQSQLAKTCNTTYSHMVKILRILENLGLIESHYDKSDRRMRFVKLTDSGLSVAYSCIVIDRELSKGMKKE